MNLVRLCFAFQIIEPSVFLEKKVRNLEKQLRKRDVNYKFQKLKDETYMRDVIMAEAYIALRDSEQHNRGRSVSEL